MEHLEGGQLGRTIFTKREIFNMMQQQNQMNMNEKLDSVEDYFINRDNFSEDDKKDMKKRFSRLKSELKRRWTEANYKEDIFMRKNYAWLNTIAFNLPKPARVVGPPSKTFNDSSERSKRRKTETLRKNNESTELLYAARVKLQVEGKRDASKILKDLNSSPQRATKYKNAFTKSMEDETTPHQLSPLKALAMFVEAGLSKNQYETIRSFLPYLPCFTVLQKTKLESYPDNIHVTENCAEANLQNLLNHTANRLLTYLEEVIQCLPAEDCNKLTLIHKWGCDGSQQSRFKQKFENDQDSDCNIFQSSIVPLQLLVNLDSGEKKVIGQNPTPSSPRYCRPIRIRFTKETTDITNEEIKYIEDAASKLEHTKVALADRVYYVKHNMCLTMVDAKVCNAATSTKSTMRCYICGATAKDFNDLSKKKDISEDSLRFGLSVLYARIRFFESLLHLAYKLPLKKWQLRNENDKRVANETKTKIQLEFRQRMGLIVDVPKAGFGNTNDGNTSRRFFMDPELAAEITGLDFQLIYRLKVILETISSGHKIHIEKFATYTMDTAKLYVEKYAWHPMTPTLHKVLVHGAVIVEHAMLPIGLLSEEAAAARNKHFRFSRTSCNQDVFNRLLLTSDPLLTGMRQIPRKRSKPFLKETLGMLLELDIPLSSSALPRSDEEEEEVHSDEEYMASDKKIISDEESTLSDEVDISSH